MTPEDQYIEAVNFDSPCLNEIMAEARRHNLAHYIEPIESDIGQLD
jgi:hypothetical protein